MFKVIALIASERTGTNYFCGLMAKALNINGMYEIFHPEMPFGLNDLIISKSLGKEFKIISALSPKDKADLLRKEPEKILNGLMKYSEKPSLFKVFSSHLKLKKLKKSILENSEVLKVFIDRSPIDVFISLRKAALLSKWGNVDTTDLKIDIDKLGFETWFKQKKEWYDFCVNAVETSNQNYISINYVDIDRFSPEELINHFLGQLSDHGCVLERLNNDFSELMQKQDRSKSVYEKVKNWEQFKNSFPNREVPKRYFIGFME